MYSKDAFTVLGSDTENKFLDLVISPFGEWLSCHICSLNADLCHLHSPGLLLCFLSLGFHLSYTFDQSSLVGESLSFGLVSPWISCYHLKLHPVQSTHQNELSSFELHVGQRFTYLSFWKCFGFVLYYCTLWLQFFLFGTFVISWVHLFPPLVVSHSVQTWPQALLTLWPPN